MGTISGEEDVGDGSGGVSRTGENTEVMHHLYTHENWKTYDMTCTPKRNRKSNNTPVREETWNSTHGCVTISELIPQVVLYKSYDTHQQGIWRQHFLFLNFLYVQPKFAHHFTHPHTPKEVWRYIESSRWTKKKTLLFWSLSTSLYASRVRPSLRRSDVWPDV